MPLNFLKLQSTSMVQSLWPGFSAIRLSLFANECKCWEKVCFQYGELLITQKSTRTKAMSSLMQLESTWRVKHTRLLKTLYFICHLKNISQREIRSQFQNHLSPKTRKFQGLSLRLHRVSHLSSVSNSFLISSRELTRFFIF